MRHSVYWTTRDLHLYAGLFVSPFVLVFAFSVFALVHPTGAELEPAAKSVRTVRNLSISLPIESLVGRARIDAIRPILDQAGVYGEVGFVRHDVKEHRLVVPVVVPGRERVVEIDLLNKSAEISERSTGIGDALILLHKSPGPHLVDIRMNWLPMRIWWWLSDATVYLVLFISASGIYLWVVLRSERRAGMVILLSGAISFVGLIYGLVR